MRCSRPTSTHWHFSAPEIPSRSVIFQPEPPQTRQVSTAFISCTSLPTEGLSLVLFIQPFFQRSEIVQDRRGVHLLLPRQCRQRFWPRLAGSHRKHRIQTVSRGFAFINRTAIQRGRAPGRL